MGESLDTTGFEVVKRFSKLIKKVIDKLFFRWYPNRALCKRAKRKPNKESLLRKLLKPLKAGAGCHGFHP